MLRKLVHNVIVWKCATRAPMLAAILRRALANMPSSAAAAAASSSNLQLHGCICHEPKQPDSDSGKNSKRAMLACEQRSSRTPCCGGLAW